MSEEMSVEQAVATLREMGAYLATYDSGIRPKQARAIRVVLDALSESVRLEGECDSLREAAIYANSVLGGFHEVLRKLKGNPDAANLAQTASEKLTAALKNLSAPSDLAARWDAVIAQNNAHPTEARAVLLRRTRHASMQGWSMLERLNTWKRSRE